ncbi:MAG TPA: exodeoxyribonuclease III [Victivallales bacterium]|nr:exodeoxyribonuclease III [Victivallales bacterium]
MKIISWNVNGFRAVLKKGFRDWLRIESPDVICLQETKIDLEAIPDEAREIAGMKSFWSCGIRKGYSGVATYSRVSPARIAYGFGLGEEFDREGRILITEFKEFDLLNIYFPNGQKDEERLRYKLAFYDATLQFCENRRKKGRELIICGDYNTAHNEIDLARPKDNEDVSGFLRIERDWMDKWEAHGYVDSFRKLHPSKEGAYTWWSMRTAARERNVGWRLDYFYLTPGMMNKVEKSEIMSSVPGSDHCPIIIELKI